MAFCRFVTIGKQAICTRCKQPPVAVCETTKYPLYRVCQFVEPPSLMKKLRTFFKAILIHALNGFRKVDWQILKSRFRTCVKCQYFVKKASRMPYCKICGCALKEKCQWQTEQCPAEYWLRLRGNKLSQWAERIWRALNQQN